MPSGPPEGADAQLTTLASQLAAGASVQLQSVLAEVSIRTYYTALLNTTNDAPMTLAGTTVTGIHRALVDSAAAFAALDRAYPSVEALRLASAGGKASEAVITTELPRLMSDFNTRTTSAPPAAAVPWTSPQADSPALSILPEPSLILRNLAAISALRAAQALAQTKTAELSLGSITAISNPASTTTAHPAIVRLKTIDRAGNCSWATGTFVSKTGRLLTAGHVTRNKVALSYWPPNGDEVPALSWGTNAAFNAKNPGADFGEAYFEDAPATMPIDPNYYPPGTPVGMAGFGGQAMSLGCGYNTIAGYNQKNGLLIVSAPGSVPEPGDSGSPLLSTNGLIAVNNGGNQLTTPQKGFYAPVYGNEGFVQP